MVLDFVFGFVVTLKSKTVGQMTNEMKWHLSPFKNLNNNEYESFSRDEGMVNTHAFARGSDLNLFLR